MTTLRAYCPDQSISEPSGELTVRQVVDAYLLGTAKRQSAKVLEERRRLLTLFCADFGDVAAEKLRKFQVEDWIVQHETWKSDWTIKRVVGTLQVVFNWAAKGDRITRNPLSGLSHPAGERGRPLMLAEFQSLLRSTSPIFRRVLIFQRFSGARPCEMSHVEWSMIDFDRSCITMTIHKTSRTRKDRAPRVIALHPPIVKLLLWIRKRQKAGEKYVFLNARGRVWNKNSLGLRIYRLKESLGLPKDAKMYGLRHLFGTQACLNGVDLKLLAELLGHTTTRMTEHYTHVAGARAHLQAALEKAFGKSAGGSGGG